MNNKITRLFPFLILIVLVFFAQNNFKKISVDLETNSMVTVKRTFFGEIIQPEAIMPILGLKLVIADFIWLDQLINRDYAEKNKEYSNYFRASKNLQILDPYNFYSSQYNGLKLSMVSGDLNGATEIFETACVTLKNLIDSDATYSQKFKSIWSLFMYSAYHLIFEKLDFLNGKKWLSIATETEGAPPILSMILDMVETSIGRNKIASAILNEMYRNATNEDEKKQIKDRILNIAKEQELIDLNEKYFIFLKTTGASKLSKQQAFKLFLRAYHLEDFDSFGRKIYISDDGSLKAK